MLLLVCALVGNVAAESKAVKVFGEKDGTRNASISALVINASTGKVIDAFNPDMVLAPASCTKLLSTCTAMELLGADFCFPTYLEIHTPSPRSGTPPT